jgi:hypothetical protein
MSVLLYDRISPLDFHTPYVKKSSVGYALLSKTEHYVNGAIIQWNRIQSMKIKMRKDRETEFREVKKYMTELREIWKIEDPQLRLQKRGEHREKSNIKFGTSETHKMDICTIFLDVHFYFICCEKVQILINQLKIEESDEELGGLWKDLKPKFKPYNDARNCLEHVNKEIGLNHVHDTGNLNGDKFIFGGKEFDISLDSLKFICDSYERVFDILIK